MATVSNPRKKFNFSIKFPNDALQPFLVQNVEIPEREIEVVEHGDTNFDVKTGGRVKLGMITLEKILVASGSDTYFEDWMVSVQDEMIGGGGVPGGLTGYKRTMVITEFKENGTAPINTWTCYGCWPSKRNSISLSRTESDNTIESVEICVDTMTKTT